MKECSFFQFSQKKRRKRNIFNSCTVQNVKSRTRYTQLNVCFCVYVKICMNLGHIAGPQKFIFCTQQIQTPAYLISLSV